MAVLDDGSILLSGFTADSFAGKNIGSYDVAAIKLDANGNEIWRYQVSDIAIASVGGDRLACDRTAAMLYAAVSSTSLAMFGWKCSAIFDTIQISFHTHG